MEIIAIYFIGTVMTFQILMSFFPIKHRTVKTGVINFIGKILTFKGLMNFFHIKHRTLETEALICINKVLTFQGLNIFPIKNKTVTAI